MNSFFKKFRQDVSGVAWLAGSLFLCLALFSFKSSDPSLNSTGVNLKVHNYCGYIGSFVADLLYQCWGLSAWLLVAACLRLCFRAFRGDKEPFLSPRLIWGILLITTVASLMALHMPTTRLFGNHVPVGGLVGTVVSKGLVSAFNYLGVSIILWSIMLLLLVFYTEKTLGEIFHVPLTILNNIRELVAERAPSMFQLFEFGGLEPATAGASESGKKERKKRLALPAKKEKAKKEEAEDEGDEESDDDEELKASPKAEAKVKAKARAEEDADEEGEDEEVESEPKPSAFARVLKIGSDTPRRKVKMNAKVERRIENWKLPELSLLEDPPATRVRIDEREIKAKAQILVDKFSQFSVKGEVTGVKPGPSVTMYEFKPNADVKISRITDLGDDLQLALSSESVRIIAPLPGRDVVGIETANSQREMVYLKDILATDTFWSDAMKLPLCLGRQADGEPKVIDLRKIPHLMIAGTTGSGKSVFVVACLTGLLFRHSPKTLRLILIDPKQVDLTLFSNIPHLIMPPISEAKKAVSGLKWAVREMDKRYKSLKKFGARNLEGFNEMVAKLTEEQVKEHETMMAEWEGDVRKLDQYYFTPQPYIVIVVEEFADLMVVDKANVENLVVRLAQMARAAGIHLMLATQSPRKDVVTGLIKTNIPGRIAFKVASKLDSRIVLDEGGSERLLPNGDNLYLAPGVHKPQRHQAPWLTEAEISGVIKFWAAQGEPQYDPLAMKALDGGGGGYDLGGDGEGGGDGMGGGGDNEYDDRYDEVLAWVGTQKFVSASLLQRKFKLGYPRAARMIEIFEREGAVGPANGSKPRQVLIGEIGGK